MQRDCLDKCSDWPLRLEMVHSGHRWLIADFTAVALEVQRVAHYFDPSLCVFVNSARLLLRAPCI